jgi:hypothetical protein
VEAGEDPWPPRVEAEALDPVALGLELGQHRPAGASSRRPRRWRRRGAERRRWIWEGRAEGENGDGWGGGRCFRSRERGDLGFGRGGGC